MIHYLPSEARRVLVVVNPTAGAGARGGRVESLRERLEQQGLVVEIVGDLGALTQAVAAGNGPAIRAVVAAGGDGTVAAVVNATLADTPVTVLPLGTENLLAKYLEYPLLLADLSHAILHGATVALDVGRANDRLFLLMASCGFDAQVVRRLHADRRGHIRHATYVKPILESIRRYQYPEIRISCDPDRAAGSGDEAAAAQRTRAGGSTLSARWVFVVNIPKYAGGLRFVPGARADDGQLDLCLFQRGSLLHGLRYLAGIVQGRHSQWPDCRCQGIQSIRVESEQEVPYQLDGDPGGLLPVDIAVVPGRVRLLVSEAWAVRQGLAHAARENGPDGRD